MKVNLNIQNRQQIKKTISWMHELYAYAGMRIYLTMWLTTKENTEINYESKYETIEKEIMLQVKRATNLSILWAKLLYIFKREN